MPKIRQITLFASLLVGLIFAIGAQPRASVAAPAAQSALQMTRLVELRADPRTEIFRLPPPARFVQRRAPLATVTVNFSPTSTGTDVCTTWTPQAQAAFSYAASIWASLLNSSVPITIDACWATNLGSGILGHGGARNFFPNFTGAPQTNTWYPVALANSLHGSDLDPSYSDIYIAFSNAFNWYTGTDQHPGGTQYDLVTVSLHEMGHGLGFLGLMKWDDGSGTVECNGTYGVGCWGSGTSYPAIYDRFTQNGSAQLLISAFPNFSAALGNELISNNVYFNGTNARTANGGANVKLHAPNPWSPGSSYAHLDYNTFRLTDHRLMVYALAAGTSIHQPGSVTMGLMQDIGWVPQQCYTLTTAANPSDGGGILANPAPNCGGTQYIEGTVVTLTAFPGCGRTFLNWSGDLSSSTNPDTITLSAAKSVTANFSASSSPCYNYMPFVRRN